MHNPALPKSKFKSLSRQLDLGPNTLAQKIDNPGRYNPRITYHIPPEKIQKMLIQFQETTNLAIQTLTQKMYTSHLHHTKWVETQEKFQEIINTLSTCMEETCLNTKTPIHYRTGPANKEASSHVNNKNCGNVTSRPTIALEKPYAQHTPYHAQIGQTTRIYNNYIH